MVAEGMSEEEILKALPDLEPEATGYSRKGLQNGLCIYSHLFQLFLSDLPAGRKIDIYPPRFLVFE